MTLVIGIDTSNYCSRSCAAIGEQNRVHALHKKMQAALKTAGYSGEMHWRRIRKNARNRAKRPLSQAIKESGMTFVVFDHPRPRDWRKEDFFARELPNAYARELEPYLREAAIRGEKIWIDCDKDFAAVLIGGTNKFLAKLLKNLGNRLAGVDVSPSHETDLTVRIGMARGRNVQIIGREADGRQPAICIADVVLGLTAEASLDRVVKKRV